MVAILRRRKLGKTSCTGIMAAMVNPLSIIRNDKDFPEGHDLIIRWGTTSNLQYKATVMNEAKAIHWVADKATSRKIMADAGLAPKTWLDARDLIHPECGIGWTPKIVRKRSHSQGRDLYHCDTPDDVVEITNKLGEGNYYISEYIPKVAEYRVFVGSGRVVWVAKKTPADEKAIAWNVAQGGRFDNVRWMEWDKNVCRTAIEAWKLSGLDFGGVDVMVDANGKAYVLEINSAPSQTSPYRQQCVAKYFDYIIDNGKGFIETKDYKGYLGYIHPAISKEARV